MNGQIKLELHQEREMVYGRLTVVSGSFPTTTKTIPIYGLASADEPAALQNTSLTDTDTAGTIYSLRIIAALHYGRKVIDGEMRYFDAQGRSDTGSFSLTRSGSIY